MIIEIRLVHTLCPDAIGYKIFFFILLRLVFHHNVPDFIILVVQHPPYGIFKAVCPQNQSDLLSPRGFHRIRKRRIFLPVIGMIGKIPSFRGIGRQRAQIIYFFPVIEQTSYYQDTANYTINLDPFFLISSVCKTIITERSAKYAII